MVANASGPSSNFYLSAVIARILVEEYQRKTCLSKINNLLEQPLVISKWKVDLELSMTGDL